MSLKTKDGKFEIISSLPLKESKGAVKTLGVLLRAIPGSYINLANVADAIEELYSDYDYNSRKLAPSMSLTVQINTKAYNFQVQWEPEYDQYLCVLAKQITL